MKDNIASLLITAIGSLTLMACTSTVQKSGIAAGTALNLEPTRIQRADFSVDSKLERRSKGAAAGTAGAIGGAALGGVAGAAVGLGCGPLFFICSPAAAVGGAALGGAALGGAAAVSVGKHGISGDVARDFNAASKRLPTAAVLETRLHEKLQSAANARWQLNNESSNTLFLTMRTLEFEQLSWDRARLSASVRVQAKFDDDARELNIKYAGAPRFAKSWATEVGLFEDEIEVALDAIVERTVTTLARSASVNKGPLGEEPEAQIIGNVDVP